MSQLQLELAKLFSPSVLSQAQTISPEAVDALAVDEAVGALLLLKGKEAEQVSYVNNMNPYIICTPPYPLFNRAQLTTHHRTERLSGETGIRNSLPSTTSTTASFSLPTLLLLLVVVLVVVVKVVVAVVVVVVVVVAVLVRLFGRPPPATGEDTYNEKEV